MNSKSFSAFIAVIVSLFSAPLVWGFPFMIAGGGVGSTISPLIIHASTITASNTVSIGTTTNPNSSTLYLYGGAANNETILMQSDGTGTGSSDGIQFQMGSANASIVNREGGTFTLGTSNTTDLTISAAANVGIGDFTPSSKFDVRGNATIGTTYSGSFAAPASGLLVEGSVGVGSIAPQSKLVVSSGAITVDGTGAALTVNGPGAFTGAVTVSSNVGTTFAVNSSDLVVDSTNHRVGVANSSPLSTLHVGGTISANTAIGIGTTTPNGMLSIVSSATSIGYVINVSSQDKSTILFDIRGSGIIDKPKQSGLRVVRTADQSITSGVNTTIAFTAATWDNQSEYNLSTSSFTATVTGKYDFTAQAWFTAPAAATILKIGIMKNGVAYDTSIAYGPAAGDQSVNISDSINLVAGDLVSVFVFQNSGSGKNVVGDSSQTWFRIQKTN